MTVLSQDEMRRRAEQARVAHVGTIDEHTHVHLVPVTFVIDNDTFYSPTDAAPRPAKRLRNLKDHPSATILVDFYDEDWVKVWWVRMRGTGRTVGEGQEHAHARRLFIVKYPQFASAPPDEGVGPMLAVDIEEWLGWAYSAD